MSPCFVPGTLVTWVKDAPPAWWLIYTAHPMEIVSCRWDDGTLSEYAKNFWDEPRQPGWVYTVQYEPDTTGYYDPPLKILLRERLVHEKYFHMEVHERLLRLAD